MCICETTNTIDFTVYNGYPISDSGYIPDNGFLMDNYDELLSDELSKCAPESGTDSDDKLDNKHDKIKWIEPILRTLFLQKSVDHKFGKPYLEFVTFCLSMVLNMDIETIATLLSEPNLD